LNRRAPRRFSEVVVQNALDRRAPEPNATVQFNDDDEVRGIFDDGTEDLLAAEFIGALRMSASGTANQYTAPSKPWLARR
jgi:hypothetical protein